MENVHFFFVSSSIQGLLDVHSDAYTWEARRELTLAVCVSALLLHLLSFRANRYTEALNCKAHRKYSQVDSLKGRWQQWADEHIQSQKLNPFSDEFDYDLAMSTRLHKGDEGYGRPRREARRPRGPSAPRNTSIGKSWSCASLSARWLATDEMARSRWPSENSLIDMSAFQIKWWASSCVLGNTDWCTLKGRCYGKAETTMFWSLSLSEFSGKST